MRKSLFILTLTLFFTSGFVPELLAEEGEGKILLLYKSRDQNYRNHIDYIGTFLKEAGFTWDERDVEKLLPEKEEVDLSQYKGVLTAYLSSQMVGGDMYPGFLLEQMEAGRKIIIVGSYGAYQGMIPKEDGSYVEWNESTLTINTFFWPFGLEFLFGWTSDSAKLALFKKDSSMVEFQAELKPGDLNYYQSYKSVNPENRVYLGVTRVGMIDSESAFVVHTPFGGMILEGYGYFWDSSQKKMLQRVDMVRFLKEGFSGISPEVPRFKYLSHRELMEKYPLPPIPAKKEDHSTGLDEIKRHVLLLYKKRESPTLEDIPFFDRAEIVLNHLGVVVEYRAVEDGLPGDGAMEKYLGIVTWHTTPFMSKAREYGEWLVRQIHNGRKVVIMQDYGARIDRDTQLEVESAKKVFQALGMEISPLKLSRSEYFAEITYLDSEMIGFERPADNRYFDYSRKYVSGSSENTIYLSLQDRYSGKVDLVVKTPHGGVAMENSAFYFPAQDSDRIARIHKALKGDIQPELAEEPTLGAWIINPYLFFTDTLGLDNLPAPDYTTANGSRIYYIHIDGDGLGSISLIDKAHFAGKFILEDHMRPYEDLPFSASVITNEVEKGGNEYYHPQIQLSREIYALPNVSVASHSSTHPFDWVGGDPFIKNPDDYPWKIGYRPQDLVYEIWGSKLFIDKNLAPEGKECSILFWSGATNPDARALEIVKAAGLKNLNGGDPVFDDEHPTLSGLVPLAVKFGNYRKFHTSAQNDYIYTLFLTGDWGGQKKVINHFEKTEFPRRILPMNLYYHFYSGIKQVSLDAVKVSLDYFREGNFAGLFADDYVSIAEDFFKTRMRREGEAIVVENDGSLRTLRFRGKVFPDMKKSEGVLGYLHHNGQTYVHLSGSKKRKIVFANSSQNTPYLKQGTFRVDDYSILNDSVTFSVNGFGKAYFEFGGVSPSALFVISMKEGDREVIRKRGRSDKDGYLPFTHSLPAPPRDYTLVIEQLKSRI